MLIPLAADYMGEEDRDDLSSETPAAATAVCSQSDICHLKKSRVSTEWCKNLFGLLLTSLGPQNSVT